MLSTHDDFRNLDTILVGSHGARGRPDEELSEPDGRRRRQPSIGNLPVTASFPRIGFQAWMPIDPQRRWLGQNTIAHSRFKGAEFVVSNPKWVVRGGLRTNVGDLRVQSVRPLFPVKRCFCRSASRGAWTRVETQQLGISCIREVPPAQHRSSFLSRHRAFCC
jgi:hypothetical protein